MIILHQYPDAFGFSSLSPFCLKVETYLRLAGLDFEVCIERNPLRGPRGKMPFIECDGAVISDSHWILDHLEGKHGHPLDGWLSASERAVVFSVRRMLDEDLIRVILYSRWIDDRGWEVLSREFYPLFPLGLRRLVLAWLRRRQRARARGMSILEFSPEEVYRLGEQHLASLSSMLGESQYLLGGQPSTADAAAYAFLSTILKTPIPVPLRTSLLADPRLARYCERIDSLWIGS